MNKKINIEEKLWMIKCHVEGFRWVKSKIEKGI